MKYEITPEFDRLFSPEDPYECRLVFETIHSKLAGFLPYFCERNPDEAANPEFHNGAWFVWPFYIPHTLDPPLTILVDVALPADFYDQPDLPVRWSVIKSEESQHDLLLSLVRIFGSWTSSTIGNDQIWLALRTIAGGFRAHGRKRKQS